MIGFRRSGSNPEHRAMRNNLLPWGGGSGESPIDRVIPKSSEMFYPVGGFDEEAYHCVNSSMYMPFHSEELGSERSGRVA